MCGIYLDEKKHALGRQFSARSDDSSEKVKAIHSPQKVDLQKSLSVVSNEGVEEVRGYMHEQNK